MLVDLRLSDRLAHHDPAPVGPVLDPVIEALARDSVDASRVRVVCDWIQYRHNFREPLAARPVCGTEGDEGLELAVDLRRAGEVDWAAAARTLLQPDTEAVALEGWAPGARSCIWAFNALYWQALHRWEEATGRGYESALPGGRSGASRPEAARDAVASLFQVWDGLAGRRALPEELYVVELGVGDGTQARVFLDELARADAELDRGYYRRLRYLMGDYSPRVLELARANVAAHAEQVSTLVLDATRPEQTLGFLRHKVFLVYICNVYDNLPTGEIARIGGRLYQVQVRAQLPGCAAGRLSAAWGVPTPELAALVERLLSLGPDLLAESQPQRFPTPLDAVAFWRAVWDSLRLAERYVPLEALDEYEVAPGMTGEALRSLVESDGDLRLHVSNGALASFANTLPLLHPFGSLHCHDLFVSEMRQYACGFRGPGKYEGSVVNWVNGPLLDAVGRRRGFEVGLAPFPHAEGTRVSTLHARVRE